MPPTNGREQSPPRTRTRRKRIFGAWVWVIAVCLSAFIATYVMFVEPPPPHKIVIASGGKTGAYYRHAQRYADELRKEGLDVDVRETAGSVENLHLLRNTDSGVTLAIVQGGVASPDDAQKLVALGSLYREPLWVFHRGDKPVERLTQLGGKRIGVGPSGSGTHAVALQLLSANGITEANPTSNEAKSSSERSQTALARQDVASAAKSLQQGELDAAFFVAGYDADYIQRLLFDSQVKLMSFDRQEAYHRRFRFLAPVSLPMGIVDLGRNIPNRDCALIAPTATLVVRRDFHPALVPLLLMAATRIHGKGDELSSPGEFPSPSYCDLPVSEDARHFYKSGQPVLQRLLPFWGASLVDRAKVMLIPLVMLAMPLLRAAPPLLRWRTRRRIYRWYSDLRGIDQHLIAGMSGPESDQELAHLKEIEQNVARVDVPLSYMEEFYHLRMHLALLQHLVELRSRAFVKTS
jgi:TRAP transporter TAXI family solute receptor